jgi:hypothetical protein
VEAKLCGDHVIERMLDFGVKGLGGEIFGGGEETVGLSHTAPSFFVGLDALRTEIIGDHVGDSCFSPFRDVLAPAATDIEHMEKRIVSALEVKDILNFFAHFLGLALDEDGFDPVVE